MISRSDFLPAGSVDDDMPCPLDSKRTVPTWEVTKYMLDALDLKPHETLLEIGTGSGYQCACWAERCKEVVSIEVDPIPGVAEKLPRNVVLVQVSMHNFETDEKFDAVVVSCGISRAAASMLSRFLKIGGRMVAPVGESGKQELLRLDMVGNQLSDDRGPLAYLRFGWMEL